MRSGAGRGTVWKGAGRLVSKEPGREAARRMEMEGKNRKMVNIAKDG